MADTCQITAPTPEGAPYAGNVLNVTVTASTASPQIWCDVWNLSTGGAPMRQTQANNPNGIYNFNNYNIVAGAPYLIHAYLSSNTTIGDNRTINYPP